MILTFRPEILTFKMENFKWNVPADLNITLDTGITDFDVFF